MRAQHFLCARRWRPRSRACDQTRPVLRWNTQIAALAIAPPNNIDSATALYAADQYGGLFKSVDHGFTWSGTGQNVRTTDFAVDPQISSIIYLAGDAVSKTTNVAATWVPVNSGLTDTLVAYGFAPEVVGVTADATMPTTVYASTRMGVFKSTNGGTSWARTGFAQQSLREVSSWRE